MSLAGGTCMMFRKTQLAVTLLAVSLSQQSVVLSFIAANKYHRLFFSFSFALPSVRPRARQLPFPDLAADPVHVLGHLGVHAGLPRPAATVAPAERLYKMLAIFAIARRKHCATEPP